MLILYKDTCCLKFVFVLSFAVLEAHLDSGGFHFHSFITRCLSKNVVTFFREFSLLARPTDQKTIDYLIHIGHVLSGATDTDNDDIIEKGELLDPIMTTLEMTEPELTGYISRSVLSTARQIIGAKYPGEHVVYADVKKEHIKAIVGQCMSLFRYRS